MDKFDRPDRKILGFWLALAAGGLLFAAFAGCDHGGDVPYDVPFCAPSDGVFPCPGMPTKNTVDGLHAVQVDCTDSNVTMSCQIDTGKTYAYAACSRCGTQWRAGDVRVTANPDTLAEVGVHLCQPLAFRTGEYCAICSDPGLSMQFAYEAPGTGGFSSGVVCVHDCSACSVVPQ